MLELSTIFSIDIAAYAIMNHYHVVLHIDPRHWVYLTKDFESPFKSLVGSAYKSKQACEQMGKNWVQGVKRCAEVFPDT